MKKKPVKPAGFTFTLFGEEWTVEIRDGAMALDGVCISGYCDADARTIVLARHDDVSFLRKVFGHEWLHAVVSAVSVNALKGREGWLIEECTAELVGRAFNELMVQSHVLPAWVCNRGKV